jgi:hypothetical protein
VSTPGHVSRYIRVHKNPGHVATFPSSAAESITLTNNMLATTGKITVQIWFQDYDVPSIREITCPRIPICTLIRCNLCIERWLNFSCYDAYHWVILSSLGLLGAGLIILCTQVLRTAKNISWYLSWPVRCLIRSLKRRSPKSTPKSRNDEEAGIPLIHLDTPPNPYAPTTSRIRRPRHRSYLMNLFQLLNLIAITQTCSNFAMLSASTTECELFSCITRMLLA